MRSAIALAVLLAFALSCEAGSRGPCDARVTRSVQLTVNLEAVASVSVQGPACEQALYIFRITTAEGRELYRFSQALSEFLSGTGVTASDELAAQAVARRLVASIFDPHRRFSDLPPYQPGTFEPDELSSGRYLISGEQYSRLRMVDLPIITHATGAEAGRDLAFDSEQGVVIAVFESWL